MTKIKANISKAIKNTSSPIKFNLAAMIILCFMIILLSLKSILPETFTIILVSILSCLFVFVVIWTVIKAPNQPINYTFNSEAHIALHERLSDDTMKNNYVEGMYPKKNIQAPITLPPSENIIE